MITLLPCYSFEDFSLYRDSDEAQEILSTWTALYHPALLEFRGRLPEWERATNPIYERQYRLIVIPPCCESLVPRDWLASMEKSDAVIIRNKKTREEIVQEALQQLNLENHRFDADFVQSCFACGYTHLVTELMNRKLRYMSNLDTQHFGEFLIESVNAARSEIDALSVLKLNQPIPQNNKIQNQMSANNNLNENSLSDNNSSNNNSSDNKTPENVLSEDGSFTPLSENSAEHFAQKKQEYLQKCFDLLMQSREFFFPISAYLLDLTQIPETASEEDLIETLQTKLPEFLLERRCNQEQGNLILPTPILEIIVEKFPRTLEILRQELAEERLFLIGSDKDELPLFLFNPLNVGDRILDGLEYYMEKLGKRPVIFGRNRAGFFSNFPQILKLTGFSGAILYTVDGWELNKKNQSRIQWQGADGTVFPTLARTPVSALSSEPFLQLPETLGRSSESDHVATLVFRHSVSEVVPWLSDMQRTSRFAPVLGRLLSIEEYFNNTFHSGLKEEYNFDSFRTNHLTRSHRAKRQNPISLWRQYFGLLREKDALISLSTFFLAEQELNAQNNFVSKLSDDQNQLLSDYLKIENEIEQIETCQKLLDQLMFSSNSEDLTSDISSQKLNASEEFSSNEQDFKKTPANDNLLKKISRLNELGKRYSESRFIELLGKLLQKSLLLCSSEKNSAENSQKANQKTANRSEKKGTFLFNPNGFPRKIVLLTIVQGQKVSIVPESEQKFQLGGLLLSESVSEQISQTEQKNISSLNSDESSNSTSSINSQSSKTTQQQKTSASDTIQKQKNSPISSNSEQNSPSQFSKQKKQKKSKKTAFLREKDKRSSKKKFSDPQISRTTAQTFAGTTARTTARTVVETASGDFSTPSLSNNAKQSAPLQLLKRTKLTIPPFSWIWLENESLHSLQKNQSLTSKKVLHPNSTIFHQFGYFCKRILQTVGILDSSGESGTNSRIKMAEYKEISISKTEKESWFYLRNEFFEVNIDPATGEIRGIFTFQTNRPDLRQGLLAFPGRGNRLAQQIGYRLSEADRNLDTRGTEDGNHGYSIMSADKIEILPSEKTCGKIRIQGRLVKPSGELAARFDETLTVRQGSRVIELDMFIDPLEKPTSERIWDSYYACRFAWKDSSASVRIGVQDGIWPTERDYLQAPSFVDVRSDEKTGVTLLTGGLPFHRRYGTRRLDTVLISERENERHFRLGIGIDLENPMQSALDFQSPSPILLSNVLCPPTREGSFLTFSVPRSLILRVEPLSDLPPSPTKNPSKPRSDSDFQEENKSTPVPSTDSENNSIPGSLIQNNTAQNTCDQTSEASNKEDLDEKITGIRLYLLATSGQKTSGTFSVRFPALEVWETDLLQRPVKKLKDVGASAPSTDSNSQSDTKNKNAFSNPSDVLESDIQESNSQESNTLNSENQDTNSQKSEAQKLDIQESDTQESSYKTTFSVSLRPHQLLPINIWFR